MTLTRAGEDVDLEVAKPALLVRRTLTRGEDGRGWTVGASTKSGKGRRVRLSRRAAAALKEHRKRQLEERMRLSGLWQDLGLVFPAATGSLFNPSNLRNRSFVRIKTRSGVREDLRFHDLRHTFGTRAISKASILQVKEWMGHADVQTTMQYLHYAPRPQDALLLAEAFRDDTLPGTSGAPFAPLSQDDRLAG